MIIVYKTIISLISDSRTGKFVDELRAIRYFIKVVETGNFSRAAKVFSVPPSSLSRRVADLERRLGATLLQRSTRVVQVTEIGRLYFEQIQNVLSQLEQANEAVRSYQQTPIGQLRISSMVGFGERILLELLEEFSQLYPNIIIDLSLTDELSKLGRDDIDIAIRGGYAPNERVQAIRLMDNEFVPAAAPSYLARMGTPKSPLELHNHRGLYFRTPNGPSPWLCELDGQWQNVSAPQVAISNNGKWLANKAIDGQGIVMAPRWMLTPYFENGELKEISFDPVLRISQNDDLAMYLLYQQQRYQVPKVKVAVDFLVAKIQELFP